MANEGNYLNLKPHNPSWSVYAISGPYIPEYRVGELAPAQYGGLSYQVLEDIGGNVYVIQTESFGKVAIWAGDSDSSFTASPVYTNGSSAPTGGTGLYLNLSPSVPSWSIYHPNGPYLTNSRIGTLAPVTYGGLSYEILEKLDGDIYIIQTESFGKVAIWAGDSDSTFTTTPVYLDPINGGMGGGNASGTGQYLNLHPHIPTWSVYNVSGPYLPESRVGLLAPAQYGGLSYAILGSPVTDVYTIQTESLGTVAIWAGDNDSSITGTPIYDEGSFAGGSSSETYLNLSPTINSWSVYSVQGPYVPEYRVGTLAPSTYGGLSYRILETKVTDVYVIQTESFGKVAIWAGDSDSSFTASPVYSGNTEPTGPGGGLLEGIDFSNAPITIESRASWGANPVQLSGMSGELDTAKYIVIHHTAGAQPQVGSDYQVMRGVQNYHQSLDWGDIGYHFCIGQQGTIMEGRSLPYVGAHVGSPHNYDSIGVSLFGDFTYAYPEKVQMEKLIPLLTYLCKEYGISPNNILGHRDMDSNYGATSCPGTAFYHATNRLEDIRKAVKKQLLEDDTLSLAEKKSEILNHMKNNFFGIPFFKDIPLTVDMWETEKSIRISSNIVMKVKLTLDINSDSPVANLFSVNITKPQLTLEGPYFDYMREKQVDDIEFYNAKDAMEQLSGNLDGKGNVVLSVGYRSGKMLYNYIVNFNSITLSDGSTMGASCRITFEIDDGTFVTPGPAGVTVSNEDYSSFLSSLEMQTIATTGVIVIGLLLVAATPLLATLGGPIGFATVLALTFRKNE